MQTTVIDVNDIENWGYEGRTGYIKSFSKKLQQMNKLLLNADEGIIDLDNHYDDLTRFERLKANAKRKTKELSESKRELPQNPITLESVDSK